MTTKYNVEDIVFAIDHLKNRDNEIFPISIHLVEILQITISENNKIEYWLKSIYSNEEWGDSVEEEYISNNILNLTPHLIEQRDFLINLKSKREE